MTRLKKLNKGDRIPASDYDVIRKYVNDVKPIDVPLTKGVPLFGESTLAVPVYSLLEIYDSSTLAQDEAPVVKVRKPETGAKRLATNSEFSITATKTGAIELITDKPVKIDIDTADTGFAVGESCGLSNGTYQVSSSGDGLICLSEPITYESTKKFVWCCADMASVSSATKIVWIASGIAARSGTTISSGSCVEYKVVAGVLTSNVDTVLVYNPWPVAIPGSFFFLATKEQLTGLWMAQIPGVLNVRWDDPDLEQTLDMVNYANIDTAVTCP